MKKFEHNDTESIIVCYFNNLFATSSRTNLKNIMHCVQPRVTLDMNLTLIATYMAEVIRMIVFPMHPSKAPGTYRSNHFFY